MKSPPPPPRNGGSRNSKKGLYELCIFLAALACGTACSIVSKILYDTRDARGNNFDKPLAQTLAMFVAMIFGLPLHWMLVYYRVKFPGYERFLVTDDSSKNAPAEALLFENGDDADIERTPRMRSSYKSTTNEERQTLLPANGNGNNDEEEDSNRLSIRTYFYLIIPALFDCIATVLCMIGLLYLDVSIYQLLRGSGIIFVALLRHYALQEELYRFQWVGVAWNVVSVFLVGATAMLDSSSESNKDSSLESAMIGVAFMLAGTLVQAMMFVFEEKVMVQDEDKVPPVLLFGMEGLWGAILTIVFLYPIASYFPGNDDGSFETLSTAWQMLVENRSIQIFMMIYCLTVFGYNLFAVLVTFSLSSVWHSILDNFRPATVWFIDLCIYYSLTGSDFGEPWTNYSWLQLCGVAVLMYGTAIYNAPDGGSVRLCGEWYSLGMDFSDEYREIHGQRLFSMGSYPSLQRFLTSSWRSNLGYGRPNLSDRVASPRISEYATFSEAFQRSESL